MTFLASKLGITAVTSLVGVAAIIGGFLWIKIHYTREGYTKAITEMAKRDGKAIAKGSEIEKQVARCFDGGGEWNVSTHKCEGEK